MITIDRHFIIRFFKKLSGVLNNFFKDFIYFLQIERKGGRKRGRETSMCGCLLHAPYWGPGLHPRHVPWLGIELVTLWFTGWHSIHWATPVSTEKEFLPSKTSTQWEGRPNITTNQYYNKPIITCIRRTNRCNQRTGMSQGGCVEESWNCAEVMGRSVRKEGAEEIYSRRKDYTSE